MRRTIFAFVLASLATGCSEYEFVIIEKPWSESVSPEVESPVQQDRLVQVTTPAVDILWVVDNSCSMDAEQTALTDNFDAFMGYFIDSGLDWHVGVVSTDMTSFSHSGKLRVANGVNYLDETEPTPIETFGPWHRWGLRVLRTRRVGRPHTRPWRPCEMDSTADFIGNRLLYLWL